MTAPTDTVIVAGVNVFFSISTVTVGARLVRWQITAAVGAGVGGDVGGGEVGEGVGGDVGGLVAGGVVGDGVVCGDVGELVGTPD